MKRTLAIVLVALLAMTCLGVTAAEAPAARGVVGEVIVDSPAQEVIVNDPYGALFFNAADQYYITNGNTVTVRFNVPEGTDPARCFVQIAFDFWTPHMLTDLPVEDGYYVFTSEIDTLDTTGFPMSDFQIYIDQVPNPDQYPDYIINLYADAANIDLWCADFNGVTWEYADNPEPTPEPEPEPDPTPIPDPLPPATGLQSALGIGIALVATGAGAALIVPFRRRNQTK
ncbi:MAG: hypothetical protein Q4B99_06815 [Clostridia bacterium]|nr:hypothetical protein [Clostridia bacterium]